MRWIDSQGGNWCALGSLAGGKGMRRLFLIIAMLLTPVSVFAEQLTLDAAIRQALAHAPGYLASQAGREATREDVALARAWLLPQISGNGSYTHMRQRYTYDQPPTAPLATRLNYNISNFSLQLIQPLFHWDRWASYQRGKLVDQAAGIGLRLARQSLILEVADRYANAVAARMRMLAVQSNLASVEKSARMSAKRLDAGLGTITEKLEAESRERLVAAQLLDVKRAWTLAVARLASLIGGDETQLPALLPNRLPAVRLPPPHDWREEARKQALAVRLAELQREIADRDIDQARGQAMPGVDLVAGIVREKETSGLFFSGSTRSDETIGIRVEVPIYSGGGTWAQLRKSRKQKLKAEFQLEDARHEAALAAREASLSLRAAHARVAALSRAVEAARAARDAARTSYKAGLVSIVDLLDADSRLAESRSELAQAQSDLLLTRLALDAAVGSLDVGRLPLPGHGEKAAAGS